MWLASKQNMKTNGGSAAGSRYRKTEIKISLQEMSYRMNKLVVLMALLFLESWIIAAQTVIMV